MQLPPINSNDIPDRAKILPRLEALNAEASYLRRLLRLANQQDREAAKNAPPKPGGGNG